MQQMQTVEQQAERMQAADEARAAAAAGEPGDELGHAAVLGYN